MSTDSFGMEVRNIGIGSVLEGSQLVMPANQREYSWGEEHVLALLQDITEAVTDNRTMYFLGTIVGIPIEDASKIEIIDGQQRLATSSIFLRAILDYMVSQNRDIQEDSIKRILFTPDPIKNIRAPSLKLNTLDHEYFRARMEPGSKSISPSKHSHKLIDAAFKLSQEHVQNIVSARGPRDSAEYLAKWIDFIKWRACVLFVKVPTHSSAYKMFETLNDRGLRTTQGDLVKNYLLGRSGDRFDEVQHKWNSMKGVLETVSEKNDLTIEFMRHSLNVVNGYTKKDELFDVTQLLANNEQKVVDFTEKLESLSSCYAAVHMKEHDKWAAFGPDSRKAIATLRRLDVSPLIPAQMAIVSRFNKKHGLKALNYLIAISVRLLILHKTRTSKIPETIAKVSQDIHEKRIYNFDQFKEEMAPISYSDVEFTNAFSEYTTTNTVFARYLLRSIEQARKEESEPWYVLNEDANAITLEHILPKKPLNNWEAFSVEEHQYHVNKLGNQTLMQASTNSHDQSSEFGSKIEGYSNSPYLITREVADCEDWTATSISERQKALAKTAKLAWPL